MYATAEIAAKPLGKASGKPLGEQIAEAVLSDGVPISRLLRLMWALDAEPGPANENLRVQLRARIGAPRAI